MRVCLLRGLLTEEQIFKATLSAAYRADLACLNQLEEFDRLIDEDLIALSLKGWCAGTTLDWALETGLELEGGELTDYLSFHNFGSYDIYAIELLIDNGGATTGVNEYLSSDDFFLKLKDAERISFKEIASLLTESGFIFPKVISFRKRDLD